MFWPADGLASLTPYLVLQQADSDLPGPTCLTLYCSFCLLPSCQLLLQSLEHETRSFTALLQHCSSHGRAACMPRCHISRVGQ